jgi:hypothetical protein
MFRLVKHIRRSRGPTLGLARLPGADFRYPAIRMKRPGGCVVPELAGLRMHGFYGGSSKKRSSIKDDRTWRAGLAD